MEIEIDLRKIILGLLDSWKWIVGAAIGLGVLALIVSFILPNKYVATATVVITRPRYLANFDPRYQTVVPSLTFNRAYFDLADSDEILSNVMDQWTDPNKSKTKLDDFRKQIAQTTNGSDPTVINLSVTLRDPQEATRLANYWAGEYVKRANAVYSGQDESQVVFFQNQLDESAKQLQKAEQALVDFQQKNEIKPLSNELDTLLQGQTETLQKQRIIRQAQDDGRSLLKQLETLAPDSKIDTTNALNWMILRSRYYSQNLTTSTTTTDPTVQQQNPVIQMQIPAVQVQIQAGNPADNPTVSEQKQSIQNWISALDQQVQSSQDSLQGIEKNIFDLQGKIQALQNEQKQLELERDLNSETFTTMSRKTEEIKITIQSQMGDVQIASNAIQPKEPLSKQLTKTTAVGFIAGLLISSIAVILKLWWAAFIKQDTN